MFFIFRYPAKICRIDSTDKKALIHFEGWNHRFDEWIPFDSEKIRSSSRSVEYKEEKLDKPSQVCKYHDINCLQNHHFVGALLKFYKTIFTTQSCLCLHFQAKMV